MAGSKENIGKNKDLIIRFVLASHPPISSSRQLHARCMHFFVFVGNSRSMYRVVRRENVRTCELDL